MGDKRVVWVTSTQRRAAQLLVRMDREAGEQPSPAVLAIAEAKRPPQQA